MKTNSLSHDIVVSSHAIHPCLQPFIQKYVFRKTIIPPACTMKKVMPLRSESSIDFFLGDHFDTMHILTGNPVPFERCTIRGPRTNILYFILLKGEFISFTIKFKATGLYKLLGIPMDMFTNKAISANNIDQLPFEKITQRLLHARDMTYCIQILEPYLLFLAERSRPVPIAIEKAALLIEAYHESYSISNLANKTNVSQRQLERHFIKYMGVSAKTYYRMHRFIRLLKAKENKPKIKWTTLAHEFGYYDQMHLVREFRNFLQTTPSSFIPSDFAF